MKIHLLSSLVTFNECPECQGYGWVMNIDERGRPQADEPDPCYNCNATGRTPILNTWRKL